MRNSKSSFVPQNSNLDVTRFLGLSNADVTLNDVSIKQFKKIECHIKIEVLQKQNNKTNSTFRSVKINIKLNSYTNNF